MSNRARTHIIRHLTQSTAHELPLPARCLSPTHIISRHGIVTPANKAATSPTPASRSITHITDHPTFIYIHIINTQKQPTNAYILYTMRLYSIYISDGYGCLYTARRVQQQMSAWASLRRADFDRAQNIKSDLCARRWGALARSPADETLLHARLRNQRRAVSLAVDRRPGGSYTLYTQAPSGVGCTADCRVFKFRFSSSSGGDNW